jgi:hypothetical protein
VSGSVLATGASANAIGAGGIAAVIVAPIFFFGCVAILSLLFCRQAVLGRLRYLSRNRAIDPLTTASRKKNPIVAAAFRRKNSLDHKYAYTNDDDDDDNDNDKKTLLRSRASEAGILQDGMFNLEFQNTARGVPVHGFTISKSETFEEL